MVTLCCERTVLRDFKSLRKDVTRQSFIFSSRPITTGADTKHEKRFVDSKSPSIALNKRVSSKITKYVFSHSLGILSSDGQPDSSRNGPKLVPADRETSRKYEKICF